MSVSATARAALAAVLTSTACGGAALPANAAREPTAPTQEGPASTGNAAPSLPAPAPAMAGVPSADPVPTPGANAGNAPSDPPKQPLPKDTLVLQIGDSFAAALGVELGKLLRAQGVRSALEYKTASYIPNWSYGGDIPKYIATYQPDLVLVTLGANEMEIPEPARRAAAIKHLVGELHGRPCVWVAPPLWKPDTGLLQVIRDNAAPCRYLDSNALVHDLPRAHDKIHPSLEGRAIWAKIVCDWLAQERVGTPAQAWALRPEPASN